jgi:hypothetical protein
MRLIARLTRNLDHPKVKHYKGFPPDLTEGRDLRIEMKPPAVLVIENARGGIFLHRYDVQANCVGDTWHQDVEEAKEQAEFEFENSLSPWVEIPPVMQQIHEFVQFGLNLFPDKATEQ